MCLDGERQARVNLKEIADDTLFLCTVDADRLSIGTDAACLIRACISPQRNYLVTS